MYISDSIKTTIYVSSRLIFIEEFIIVSCCLILNYRQYHIRFMYCIDNSPTIENLLTLTYSSGHLFLTQTVIHSSTAENFDAPYNSCC